MNNKVQKIVGILFFAVIFLLFSASVATRNKGNEELEKLKAFKAAYPNTSKDYRGVVAIDANGACADELYCDFGGNGLWVYEGGWTKLNAANPDWIIGFEHGGTEYLLCDFGAAGLWYWQYGAAIPGQFVKVSTADPDQAFVSDCDFDGDDEVFLTFGANGLWVYDKGAATILTKRHATPPKMSDSLRMDCWAAGYEEGALDFGAQGLWSHYGASTWKKLNASSPDDDNASADFDASNTSEELIIDFASTGLWAYDGVTWYRLTTSSCNDAVAVYLPTVADYELFCSFSDSAGLWMWNYASGYPGVWLQLSTTTPDWDGGFCEPFDANDDGMEEVAVDFGSNGLWLYNNTASANSWTKINANDPEFMVRSDYKCEGYDTALVVDFGASGLWLYDGKAATWTQLTTFSPDGVN